MTSIYKLILLVIIISISFHSNINAQIKNAQVEIVKVYGNCNMCKSTIEKSGTIKNISKCIWNEKTKLATLTFNKSKISSDVLLKKIALSGYDNEIYLAPNEVYNQLPACCKYEREESSLNKINNKIELRSKSDKINNSNKNYLQNLYAGYFLLKDALVNSDIKSSSLAINNFKNAIDHVEIDSLSLKEKIIWTKNIDKLNKTTFNILTSKTIDKQRMYFIDLTNNIYELIKSSNINDKIYYQHCPMANNGKGANWLSKDAEIKNPYYGSSMLTCGKVLETIN